MLFDLNLSAIEQRVLGCLVEKQHTVPDTYPLTMNALLLACNQTSNREPVLTLHEQEVELALESLRARNLARRGMYPGSRAPKHRHILDDALELGVPEQAVLAVMLLRGPQTLAELKTRTERYCNFPDLGAVDAVIDRLIAREQPLATRVSRGPGQKEDRVTHRLGLRDETPRDRDRDQPEVTPIASGSQSRVELLELRVAALEQQVETLRSELGLDDPKEDHD